MPRPIPSLRIALGLAMLTAPAFVTPAAAQQQSEGYKFLKSVEDAKNDEVIRAVETPGSTIINTRDRTNGQAALHIVIKRNDAPYVSYLLTHGADPNIRDDKGNTPMLLAVIGGSDIIVQLLAAARANANLGNSAGETPLILAVQRRDIAMVRTVLAAGADPDQADRVSGRSARDYATLDPRNTAIAKLLADTPKKTRAAVAGPKL